MLERLRGIYEQSGTIRTSLVAANKEMVSAATYAHRFKTFVGALRAARIRQFASGLFKAYAPWDGVYDFFLFDEDEEAIYLSNGQAGFFPTQDLYISGNVVGDANTSGRIDIGEQTLKGGYWALDSVSVGGQLKCTPPLGTSKCTTLRRNSASIFRFLKPKA